MDIKSALCRYLIREWGQVGQRVYQKRLPQRDGPITGGMPAVVVRLVDDNALPVVFMSTRCTIHRQSARVQIDILDKVNSRQIRTLKKELITMLDQFKGQLYEIKIDRIEHLSSHDFDLIDVGLDRIVCDFKIVYWR